MKTNNLLPPGHPCENNGRHRQDYLEKEFLKIK